MKRKILVVDDNEINRQILANILRDEYDVLMAEDGSAALSVLSASPDSVSAVLLDLIMPVLDGYSVLEKMQAAPDLSNIPVIVTTGSTELDSEVRALSLGANDFIAKPYNPDVIKHRLGNTIKLRETAAFVNAATKDKLTGIYNREAFFERASELIAEREAGFFVLSCLDIDNFKVINDRFGSERGDEVLIHVAEVFNDTVTSLGGICCRINADNYALLYPQEYMNSEVIARMCRDASLPAGFLQPLNISTGRFLVDDLSLSISGMYDRAVIARDSIKGRFDVNVAIYRESMREQILREQEIINEMNSALEGGQFEMWLQPQYNHSTGALIGAEALARWRHPERGLIPPGEFIPVFERSGFVYELDKYIWEQAAMALRRFIDSDGAFLPISVNVSRYDIVREDFFSFITELMQRCSLPVDALRLEVTESAFADGKKNIIKIVEKLSDYGFTIEIDDFGSGYSSLNTLKDVPAHILKLDMRFLEGEGNSTRGGNILESVVRMAKWLGMPVIAEGVETLKQANFLKSIGCSYIQGYLYARPMPLAEFEQLMHTAHREIEMSSMETVENLDNNSFWDPSSMDTLIFNSYVGGACIFEYFEGELEMLRVNDKFASILSSENHPLSVEDALNLSWRENLSAEDRLVFGSAIEQAFVSGDEVSCEIKLENISEDIGSVYLRTALRVIASAGERLLVYATNENITAQRRSEQKERRTAERMRAIMENVNSGVSAEAMNDSGVMQLVFANNRFFAGLGYSRSQYLEEVPDMLRLVASEDVRRVQDAVEQVISDREPRICEFRCRKRDGELINIRCNISVTAMEGLGENVLLFVLNDVSELVAAEKAAAKSASTLRAIMDNVECGITALRISKDDSLDFLFVNDRYFELMGFSDSEQFYREVSDIFSLVHPDDRAYIREKVREINQSGVSEQLEFRAIRRDGRIIWLKDAVSIAQLDGIASPVQLSIVSDITSERSAAEKLTDTDRRLRFQSEAAHELLSASDEKLGIRNMLQKTLEYSGGTRAYLIELDAAGKLVDSVSSVSDEGEPRGFDSWLNIPAEKLPFMSAAMRGDKFIHLKPGQSELSAEDSARFAADSIESVYAVPLRMNDTLVAFLGVDNPTVEAERLGQLRAVGDYILAILLRRNLNERVRNERQMLDTMMNDNPNAFKRVRVHGGGQFETVYANDAYFELTGLTREAVLSDSGYAVGAIVHPDDAASVRLIISDMIENGGIRRMSYRLRRSGGFVPVDVFGRVTRNSGMVFLNLYYTDRTELDRAEAMRRTLLDNLPCGAGLFELDGEHIRVIYLNRSYIDMIGSGEALSEQTELLSYVHPNDRARLMNEVKAAIREGRGGSADVRMLCGFEDYRAFRIIGCLDGSYSDQTIICAIYIPLFEAMLQIIDGSLCE